MLELKNGHVCPTDIRTSNSHLNLPELLQINIERDTILKTTASQGGVVVRLCNLPDSYRWIEPRTLSDKTAVIFSFQFISLM